MRDLQRAWTTASVISGLFCVLVAGMLVLNSYQIRATDPRTSPEFLKMKAQLARNPNDEALANELRRADAILRGELSRQLVLASSGGWILLAGFALFVVSLGAAAVYSRGPVEVPDSEESPAQVYRAASASRSAVTAAGGVLAAGLVALAAFSSGDLSRQYVSHARYTPAKTLSEAQAVNIPPAAVGPVLQPPGGLSTPAPGPDKSVGPPSTGPEREPGQSGFTGPFPVLPAPVRSVGAAEATAGGPPGGGAASSRPEPEKREPVKLEIQPLDTNDYSPTDADVIRNWPAFRGPGGLAHAPEGDYPTKWNTQTGENVAWKTEIPLPGWNSPVVWDEYVFVSGADKTARAVYCLNADTGQIAWKQDCPALPGSPALPADLFEDTGYAPSTLAVDGNRVFALFPNGDLFCFDFDGRRLWAVRFGEPDNIYGHASSLITYRSLLLVQYDQGDPRDNLSALYALQGGSGNVVWRAARPVGNTWSTPILTAVDESGLVVTTTSPYVFAYNPMSGSEVWRADVLGGEVAPSAAFADNVVYAVQSGSVLAALRSDGRGDVTKSAVLWRATDGLPDITSPVAAGGMVFLLTTEGLLTCYDAAKGTKLWEHSFEKAFKASPIVAGSKLYLLDSEGTAHIVAVARAFSEMSKGTVSEATHATPAFAGDRIYIRTLTRLICIGEKR